LRNDHLVDDLEKLIRDKVRQKEQQQENMIARSV
jgi:(E)-4-hydroxy-3-methylbut-2-enyl-diphosphate synthase